MNLLERAGPRLRLERQKFEIRRGAMIAEALKSSALRWGPAIVRVLVPRAARPWLARAHRPLARFIAAGKYRRRYRARFMSEIHPEDDLMHYGMDLAETESGMRYLHAVQSYYAGGEWNAAEVEEVLRDAGVSLRASNSVLEFACGFGRVARHLVHYVSPERITGSDIDARGVDFIQTKLGVRSFVSTADPDALVHDGTYAVIIVVSLFSHLPINSWGAWLRRLSAMLVPGGVMVFSTLGMHAFEVNTRPEQRAAFANAADGYYFLAQNETRGRLDGDEYGTAYVDERFVRRMVDAESDVHCVAFVPRALNDFQDAVVVRRRVPPRRK